MPGTFIAKVKGKKQRTKPTSSNYTFFNQTGKSSGTYGTMQLERYGFLGRKFGIRENIFEAKGSPVKEAIKKFGGVKLDKLGKVMAALGNVTEEYKATQAGKKPKVGDKPEVVSGADVTRTKTRLIKDASPEALISRATSKAQILELATQFGKRGKQVVDVLEQQKDAAKKSGDLETEADLKKQLRKIKKAKETNVGENLKGISNIAGAFMSGFDRNSR